MQAILVRWAKVVFYIKRGSVPVGDAKQKSFQTLVLRFSLGGIALIVFFVVIFIFIGMSGGPDLFIAVAPTFFPGYEVVAAIYVGFFIATLAENVGRAAWATATDMRVDIERIFARLVAKYEAQPEPHRFRYLVALYYVTTQVKLEDAALIAGINHHYLLDDYASTVRKDVQQAFGELYRPGLRWIDKFKRGHQTPALLVLEKYQRNPRMIYAIRSLLEEQPPTEARLKCPWPNNNQYRAKAHKALMTTPDKVLVQVREFLNAQK